MKEAKNKNGKPSLNAKYVENEKEIKKKLDELEKAVKDSVNDELYDVDKLL